MSSSRIICTVTTDLIHDQRMQRICTTLAEAGYRVTLVGRALPRSEPLVERPYAQHRIVCESIAGKLFYLEYNWRLYRYLRQQSFDAVCAVDLDTLVAATHAAKACGAKIVYDAHEYFSETPEVVRRPWVQRFWEHIAARYIPRCHAAYTVGEELAELFAHRYKKPFSVVRNTAVKRAVSINPDFINRPQKVVFYQGALNEGRGLLELLEAAVRLPSIQVWLAGEGDLSRVLRERAKELKLGARVRFLGFVSPEELRELTPKAWLGYNLLENIGLSYYYSLANKTFDYYQAGVPALHPDFPEYRNLAKQYGGMVLLPRLSAAAIMAAIHSLGADPVRYEGLRAACLTARAELVWETDAVRLRAIYADLFSSSSK